MPVILHCERNTFLIIQYSSCITWRARPDVKRCCLLLRVHVWCRNKNGEGCILPFAVVIQLINTVPLKGFCGQTQGQQPKNRKLLKSVEFLTGTSVGLRFCPHSLPSLSVALVLLSYSGNPECFLLPCLPHQRSRKHKVSFLQVSRQNFFKALCNEPGHDPKLSSMCLKRTLGRVQVQNEDHTENTTNLDEASPRQVSCWVGLP